MIGAAYRLAAAACAEAIARVPLLEPPFVGLGAQVWSTPGIGRFYRSVAYRLLERLQRRGRVVRPVIIGGAPLALTIAEFTRTDLYFGRVPYEPETTAYLQQHLGPGGVFVDVGANYGHFTLLAASRVGSSGRVVAFEPNPAVFEQLETHVRLNALGPRVTLMPDALSDEPSEGARLFVSLCETNSGLSSLTPRDEMIAAGSLSPAHTVAVRVDTFDRWHAASGIDRIDVVKIDVEGAEDRVVRGMAATLRAGVVGRIVCETTWGGIAHTRLCDAGFVPERLDAVGDGTLRNIAYVRRP